MDLIDLTEEECVDLTVDDNDFTKPKLLPARAQSQAGGKLAAEETSRLALCKARHQPLPSSAHNIAGVYGPAAKTQATQQGTQPQGASPALQQMAQHVMETQHAGFSKAGTAGNQHDHGGKGCVARRKEKAVGRDGPAPTGRALTAGPSRAAQSATSVTDHTLQRPPHGAAATQFTPAALAGSGQAVNQASAKLQLSAGAPSSGQAPQHAPAVSVSSGTHTAAQTSARLKQSAPAQHSLLKRVAASQAQQPQAALPLAGPSLLPGLLPLGTAASNSLLEAAPDVQSAAERPSQSLGGPSLLPHDRNGQESMLTLAQQQPMPAPLQVQAATASASQGLAVLSVNPMSSAQPQTEQFPAAPLLLATEEANAWQAPHDNTALPLETVIGYVFPPEALCQHLDEPFVDEVWRRVMAVKQGAAQAKPGLPDCNLSEPCNVWRLMLLRLVEWLAGVHVQGTAAKISSADAGCWRLHKILTQAAISIKTEMLTLRRLLVDIGKDNPLLLAHWCHRVRDSLLRQQVTQAASREQTEAAPTTAAPAAAASGLNAPAPSVAEHGKLPAGPRHAAGGTPAAGIAQKTNEQLPLRDHKSLSASMPVTGAAQARAQDSACKADSAQPVPSREPGHMPPQSAKHLPSQGMSFAAGRRPVQTNAAAASITAQTQVATPSNMGLPNALTSAQPRTDGLRGVPVSTSAAKQGAASVAQGVTAPLPEAALVPAAGFPDSVSAVKQAMSSPSNHVTAPVAATLQAAIKKFQLLPAPSEGDSTVALTRAVAPGAASVSDAINASDLLNSAVPQGVPALSAPSAAPIRPVVRALSAALRAGREFKQAPAHPVAAGPSEASRQAETPASQPADLPADVKAVSATSAEPPAASSTAIGQCFPTAASFIAHAPKPVADHSKASTPAAGALHACKPATVAAQAPKLVTDHAQTGDAPVNQLTSPPPAAHRAQALTPATTQLQPQVTEAGPAQVGVAAGAGKQPSEQPAMPAMHSQPSGATEAKPPEATALPVAPKARNGAAVDHPLAAASLDDTRPSASSLAGSAWCRSLRLDRSLPASTTPASVAVPTVSSRSASATASATPASASVPPLSSASASATAAPTILASSAGELPQDQLSNPFLTWPLPQHGSPTNAPGTTVKIQMRQLNPDGNLGPPSAPPSTPNAAVAQSTAVSGSSAVASPPAPKPTAAAQSDLVPENSTPVSPAAPKPTAVVPSTSAEPFDGKDTAVRASREGSRRREADRDTVAAGASPQHKAASSTNAASDFEAKAQRRQLLQQDSSSRRTQMCMEKLKTARLDIICWLRKQKVGKYLPKREAKDEKDCSKDALVKSLELYQEKCAAPLATAAVDSVIAGTKQAILLTICSELLSSDARASNVLEKFEQDVMVLVKEGVNPLKEQGHSTDELLMLQFYNSLKEAALVSLPGATRRLPSSFSDEIMKIEAANAAAAVEAEKTAVQAAAVQPEVMTTPALPVSAHSAAENSKSEVTAQHAQASAQPKKARAAAKRKASGVDRKHAAAGKAEAKDSQAEAQKAGSAGAERQEPVAGKVMASSKTPGAMPDAAAGSEPLGARIQAPEAVEKQLIVSMTDSATTCIDNAAAAAVNNQRAPASDSNMAARQNRPPLGTSAKSWAGIPLVSVGADDKLAAVLAGTDKKDLHSLQKLLSSNSDICINPVYLALCQTDEQRVMEEAGLTHNNSFQQNKAGLKLLSNDQNTVTAAALALGEQDRAFAAGRKPASISHKPSASAAPAAAMARVPASASDSPRAVIALTDPSRAKPAEKRMASPMPIDADDTSSAPAQAAAEAARPSAADTAAAEPLAGARKPGTVSGKVKQLHASKMHEGQQSKPESAHPTNAEQDATPATAVLGKSLPVSERGQVATAGSERPAVQSTAPRPVAQTPKQSSSADATPGSAGTLHAAAATLAGPSGDVSLAEAAAVLGSAAVPSTKLTKKRKQEKRVSKSGESAAGKQKRRQRGQASAAPADEEEQAREVSVWNSVSTVAYSTDCPSSEALMEAGQDGEVASPDKDKGRPQSCEGRGATAHKSSLQKHALLAEGQPQQGLTASWGELQQGSTASHGAPQQHPPVPSKTPQQQPPVSHSRLQQGQPLAKPRVRPQQGTPSSEDKPQRHHDNPGDGPTASQGAEVPFVSTGQLEQPLSVDAPVQVVSEDRTPLAQAQQQQQQQQGLQRQQVQQETAHPPQHELPALAVEQNLAAASPSADEAAGVFQTPVDSEEVACTAHNLDSMLLTKDAALSMFAFELQLEAWRSTHQLQQFHSALLGSYILVVGLQGTPLRQVGGVKLGAKGLPIFITTNDEEVPFDCLSDAHCCSEQQVLVEQARIMECGTDARLKRVQVAEANAAVRQRLCLEYFSLLKQLDRKGLSAKVRSTLNRQLDATASQTQSRPTQEVLDAVEGDVEGQEKASRERLDSIQSKLKSAAINTPSVLPSPPATEASDAPTKQHAQQKGSGLNPKELPGGSCQGPVRAQAQSDKGNSTELPHAKATSVLLRAGPAAEGSEQQTNDRAVTTSPEVPEQPRADPGAADQTCSPLELLSNYRHRSTTPERAASDPGQADGQNATASPDQATRQASEAGPDQASVEDAEAAAGSARPKVEGLALHGDDSQSGQPLLGMTAATPLPPLVLSPTRAAPKRPAASPNSPQAAQPGQDLPLASAAAKQAAKGQPELLGLSAISPLPPVVSSPTAAGNAAQQLRLHTSAGKVPTVAAVQDTAAQLQHVPAQTVDATDTFSSDTKAVHPIPVPASHPATTVLPSAAADLQPAAAQNAAVVPQQPPLTGSDVTQPNTATAEDGHALGASAMDASTSAAAVDVPGVPGEEDAVSGEAAAQAVADAATGFASQEATEHMSTWQIHNLAEHTTQDYLDGSRLFAVLSQTFPSTCAPGPGSILNVTIEAQGWWGFVEFADASLKAQAEHTYSIVVDGQVLLLVAPIEPVPAHASALAAAAPSVIPTAATYRYNHVQAVAAQTQYAPYTYPGYEYDATYGYGYGYEQWQHSYHQYWLGQQYYSLQPAVEAASTEPVRQVVPLPVAQPAPEPELHAPEVRPERITSFPITATGLRSKPVGLPAKRPAPAEDDSTSSPRKKRNGLLTADRSSPSAVVSDQGKALPLSGNKRKTAEGKPKGKAPEPKGRSSGSNGRSSGSKGNASPNSKADTEHHKAISFRLYAQAQACRQAASAAKTAWSAASASLSPLPARTATASQSPAVADSSGQPALACSSGNAAGELCKASGDLPAGRSGPFLANPNTAAGPSSSSAAASQPASAAGWLPSEMPEASMYSAVSEALAHAQPSACIVEAPGLTPEQPLTTPQAKAASETPHFLGVPQRGARPGALPEKFRFDMSQPAGSPRSDLADADLPPLPASATAEEEAAQREESEAPSLPPPPPPLPDPLTGIPDAAQQKAAPAPAVESSMVLPEEQPSQQPDQRGSRHSASSRTTRWGPEAQPHPNIHPAPLGSGQNITAEASSGNGDQHPSAAQLPEQLPPSTARSHSTCWGPPPGPALTPSRTADNGANPLGGPSDPRLALRNSRGSLQTILPAPLLRDISGSTPTRLQSSSTSRLAQPSAPAQRASPRASRPWAWASQHRPGVTSPHDSNFNLSRQLTCPKDLPISALTSAQTEPHASAWPSSHSSASIAAGLSEKSGRHHQQQLSHGHDIGAAAWYIANPDASDTCRTSNVNLSYQWGQDAAVQGGLELTASIWSSKRMGRCVADSSSKGAMSGMLLPAQLRARELGPRRALNTDSKRCDWHSSLRYCWEGSLIVFTASRSHDRMVSAAAEVELARLCCLLRDSKRPLISRDASFSQASLWLTSSQGVLESVSEYMSEEAQASLKQHVPAVSSKGSSDVQKLSFILGLLILER